LQLPAAVPSIEPAQLATLPQLDTVAAQRLGQAGRQRFRPHEAVDTGIEPGNHPASVERGLERGERRAVQLLDRPSVVAELAQPSEDRPVEIEAFRGQRRDE
jgi:hypothetical protein